MNPLKRSRSDANAKSDQEMHVEAPIAPLRPSKPRHHCTHQSMKLVILLLTLYQIEFRLHGAQAFTFPAFLPRHGDGGKKPMTSSTNPQFRRKDIFKLDSSKVRTETAEFSIDFTTISYSNGHHVNGTTTLHNGHSDHNQHHLHHSFISHTLQLPDNDIARPTPNGGFTHTTASRAKISAANRGKVPWNKGKERSPETRAKIAAGVQARNRQRFLAKLQALGLTEKEYELQQQQEEERKKQASLARRTKNGGYIPTKETKQKISRILKEKYAKNEIRPRNVTHVRRGFTHTEETRRKISESLRKRWNTDQSYRENMVKKAKTGSSNATDTRRRISETLRAKWQDPEFRAIMVAKMANRKRNIGISLDETHRRKISEAMKAKWQDEVYRAKTLESIAARKGAVSSSRPPRPPRAATPRKKRSAAVKEAAVIVRRLEPLRKPRKAESQKATNASTSTTITRKLPTSVTPVTKAEVKPVAVKRSAVAKKPMKAPTSLGVIAKSIQADITEEEAQASKPRGRKKADGDVGQLKEDRRDLFDLLYGDEESFTVNERSTLTFEDENLDSFDPYGLENE
ncbi:hypothetical protein MPSEU_001059200 [Mayamaea pseudoterrestris]|nr:hypothetical protein MPSEU_001059200 [Mayamaea pseudoterrestris]